MSIIRLGLVNFETLDPPAPDYFYMGYDVLDHELKQMDSDGNVTVIGGPGGNMEMFLSNTAYVNMDLEANLPDLRIFMTYDDAVNWIIANGEPTASNPWQIILPPGIIDNVLIVNQFIRIVGTKSTTISNLTSDIDFESNINLFFDIMISDVTIANINVLDNKIISLNMCEIYDVTNGGGTGYFLLMNCTVIKGDFTNVLNIYLYQNCNFNAINGNIINLRGLFHNCSFSQKDTNQYCFNSENENDITFKNCDLYSRNGILFINNSGFDLNKVYFYFCRVNAIVRAENLHMIFIKSYLRAFEYPFPASPYFETTLELDSTDIETIYRSGNLVCKGYNEYREWIGEITVADFNKPSGITVTVSFANVLKPERSVKNVVLVVREAFLSSSGNTILNVTRQTTSPYNFNNTIDAKYDAYVKNFSGSETLGFIFRLNSTNLTDWTAGKLDVIMYSKDYDDDLPT